MERMGQTPLALPLDEVALDTGLGDALYARHLVLQKQHAAQLWNVIFFFLSFGCFNSVRDCNGEAPSVLLTSVWTEFDGEEHKSERGPGRSPGPTYPSY